MKYWTARSCFSAAARLEKVSAELSHSRGARSLSSHLQSRLHLKGVKAGLLRDGPASVQPVAVIGLGDLEMGQLISPTLSTISVHGDAIGRTAATLTLERGGERRVDLGFELVLRDSG